MSLTLILVILAAIVLIGVMIYLGVTVPKSKDVDAGTVCNCGTGDGCDICGGKDTAGEFLDKVKPKSQKELAAEYEEKCRKAGCVICINCDKPIVMHRVKTVRRVSGGYAAQSCYDTYQRKLAAEEARKKQNEKDKVSKNS